jgi:hypothetical protein
MRQSSRYELSWFMRNETASFQEQCRLVRPVGNKITSNFSDVRVEQLVRSLSVKLCQR